MRWIFKINPLEKFFKNSIMFPIHSMLGQETCTVWNINREKTYSLSHPEWRWAAQYFNAVHYETFSRLPTWPNEPNGQWLCTRTSSLSGAPNPVFFCKNRAVHAITWIVSFIVPFKLLLFFRKTFSTSQMQQPSWRKTSAKNRIGQKSE